MLPPEEYERMTREAAGHLQLEITAVSLEPGEAVVSGRVVRVFRGPSAMIGSAIRLRIPCAGAAEDDDWAPGEPGRIAAAQLRAGRVLEAYVDGPPSAFEIVHDLYTLIDSPTDVPQSPSYGRASDH